MARGGASGGGGGGRGFGGGGGGRSFGGRSGGAGPSRGGANPGGFGRGTPVGGGRRPSMGGGLGGLGGFGMGYGLGRMGGGWGPRPFRRPLFGGGGCGCLVVPIVLIVAVIMLSIFFFAIPSGGGGTTGGTTTQITASTIRREPLPQGSVNETSFYTDELGWIRNSTVLTAGMQNFYQQTGVQPHLFLTDTIDGSHSPTEAQVEQFAQETYDALFTDEAHLLLIFFEYNNDGNYSTWYLLGSQAKTVLDGEAMDILLDYIDRHYYDSSLSDEEMFSKAFNAAAERIMSVTRSPWVVVLIVVGVLAILVVVFLWWRSYKKQKNLEAEQTQRILDTPLESFGNTEAEQRAKKYDDDA